METSPHKGTEGSAERAWWGDGKAASGRKRSRGRSRSGSWCPGGQGTSLSKGAKVGKGLGQPDDGCVSLDTRPCWGGTWDLDVGHGQQGAMEGP